jgi:hypothetical protein
MQSREKGDALSPLPNNCIPANRRDEKKLPLLALWALPAVAQDPMSLKDAVRVALMVEHCYMLMNLRKSGVQLRLGRSPTCRLRLCFALRRRRRCGTILGP